jgi:hypothetical protein
MTAFLFYLQNYYDFFSTAVLMPCANAIINLWWGTELLLMRHESETAVGCQSAIIILQLSVYVILQLQVEVNAE